METIRSKVLRERYLQRDKTGEVVETEEGLFWRVANHVAEIEGLDRGYWADRWQDRMSNGDFLPNTPTLMNAGKENGQLSACFVLPIEDSMEGIFTTLKNAALVHQTGGGTGFDFSHLRPEGSMVSNKSGVSTGPLAFCQVYDKATEVIKQGASRRGANMMTLRVDHPDILKFIEMKSTPGVMENFNVSVCVTDEFMTALKDDTLYALRHPYSGVETYENARVIWNKIAECAWKSAEPGILFIDRANRESSFHEPVETTNPCGEQFLPPYGVCNLGSINVSNFVLEGEGFDWEELEDCIWECVRFLDNVVEVNCYPLSEIDETAQKYRNIGLGLMGWADALIKIGIPYNSEEAVELGYKLQAYIQRASHECSVWLGKEKGLPSGTPFRSPFKWADPNRRNATLTTVAPTGTISLIAECSSGVEPVFAFEMERHQLDQTMVDRHPLWAKHIESGNTYKREVFVEASDVSPEAHVLMQAAFQKNVDNSISKTINLPAEATVEDVKAAYLLAWESGCKGITVYREGSRGIGVLAKLEKTEDDCCLTPNVVTQDGCETCKNCGMSRCSIA